MLEYHFPDEEIPVDDRPAGVKNVRPRIMAVARLSAEGYKNTEIAEILGISKVRVSKIVNAPQIKKLISKYNDDLLINGAEKRFQKIAKDAINVVEEVLQHPSAKPSTRLQAANMIFDRAWGKPEQKQVFEGSMLTEFMHRLDSMKDVGPKKQKDETDDFVDQFLPDTITVGARSEDTDEQKTGQLYSGDTDAGQAGDTQSQGLGEELEQGSCTQRAAGLAGVSSETFPDEHGQEERSDDIDV